MMIDDEQISMVTTILFVGWISSCSIVIYAPGYFSLKKSATSSVMQYPSSLSYEEDGRCLLCIFLGNPAGRPYIRGWEGVWGRAGAIGPWPSPTGGSRTAPTMLR